MECVGVFTAEIGRRTHASEQHLDAVPAQAGHDSVQVFIQLGRIEPAQAVIGAQFDDHQGPARRLGPSPVARGRRPEVSPDTPALITVAGTPATARDTCNCVANPCPSDSPQPAVRLSPKATMTGPSAAQTGADSPAAHTTATQALQNRAHRRYRDTLGPRFP